MFSVRVMPIAKGIFKDHLTFFSREGISPGTVVTTTIRGRKIPGIVLSSADVREEKMDIRSADFELKKLDADAPRKKIFRASFIRAIADTALLHAANEGAVAAALAPAVVLASLSKVESYTPSPGEEDSGVKADLLILQAETAERIRTYRNMAREAFARNASVTLIAPTVIEAENLAQELSRGIENRVILLTGELSKKKFLDNWNKAVSEKEPVLIVGTPVVLSVPRADTDAIVIERESARAYRGIHRPFLDVRRAAEALSRHSGARLILADFPVRVETRYRVDIHEAEELARSQIRPAGTGTIEMIDSRPKDERRGEKRVFTTLSKETKNKIASELKSGGRVAVFASRRGIAPLTVCNDCGTPISDPETGTPMTLHKTASGNVFLSHRSGAVLPSETSCKTCGGWNLVTLGIGVDRVQEELEKAFPDAKIISFTKETAPNHKAAKKISAEFYSGKGALLVGTERMLPYLTGQIELGVVASIDSMLSLSSWRAHEHALSILFYLKERAEKSLIIETRKPDSEVMKTITTGNPLDFYRNEIKEREEYRYPPFSVFIGLSALGTRAAVEKVRLQLQEEFKAYDLVGPLPAEAVGKNEWSVKAVIRMPRDMWPDRELSERLKALAQDIAVAIDPDQIV